MSDLRRFALVGHGYLVDHEDGPICMHADAQAKITALEEQLVRTFNSRAEAWRKIIVLEGDLKDLEEDYSRLEDLYDEVMVRIDNE